MIGSRTVANAVASTSRLPPSSSSLFQPLRRPFSPSAVSNGKSSLPPRFVWSVITRAIEGEEERDRPSYSERRLSSYAERYGRGGGHGRAEEPNLQTKERRAGGPTLARARRAAVEPRGVREGRRSYSTASIPVEMDDELESKEALKKAGYSLTPGSMIEVRNGDLIEHAVILDNENQGVLLCLFTSGVLERRRVGDVTYELHNFISRPLAQAALATTSSPESDPNANQPHQIVQQLRLLQTKLENQTKFILSKGGPDLYSFLKSKKFFHEPFSHISTSKALKILKLGPAQINNKNRRVQEIRHFAMHKLLIADPVHFIADQFQHHTSNTFAVRPVMDVRDFESVRWWYRTKSSEMMGFVKRAAAARKAGKVYQPSFGKETLVEGKPLKKVKGGTKWIESDLIIIRFFQSALDNRRKIQQNPYNAVASSIIKLVEESGEPLSRPTTAGLEVRSTYQTFLAEIGVVTPWENWATHDVSDLFMNWFDSSAKKATTSILAKPILDSHDSVRKDFGELPVYVIDDLGAHELDDGISLEAGPPTSTGEPSWWIHVHVADPTAMISRQDELAAVLATRAQTEYLPEQTWSMMPTSVLEKGGFSLGSLEGKEQRVLTISTRVNDTGDVLEAEVKAGIIRRTRRLTYSDVDTILGIPPRPPSTTLYSELDVSPEFLTLKHPPRPLDSHLVSTEPSISSDLTTLQKLSKAILRQRAKQALFWNTPQPTASVFPTLPLNFSTPSQPTFYYNSPLVSVTLPIVGHSPMSPSQNLVAEFMVLANRSASRFCVERGLPALFREQEAVFPPEALALRNPETGEASWEELSKLDVKVHAAGFSVTPKIHRPMGIVDEFGYIQVTSPLRRYTDILGHWQIKSALLPGGTEPEFTPLTLKAVLLTLEASLKPRNQLGRQSNLFWSLYVLNKKWKDPSSNDVVASELLENLTCFPIRTPTLMTSVSQWTQRVYVPELGVMGHLMTFDEREGLALGEKAGVRITDIELSERPTVYLSLKNHR